MSGTISSRSTLFVWSLLSVLVVIVMAFSHSVAMSAEKAINDEEATSYLPFVTNIGTSEPDGPILISPENNVTLQTLIPTYIWDVGTPSDDVPIQSCLAWGQELADLNGCWIYGWLGSVGEVRTTSKFNLKPDTYYYWRVGFIIDFNWDDFQWSEPRGFTTGPSGGVKLPAPTHTAPSDNSAVPEQALVLQWEPVTGAVEYTISIHDLNEERYISIDVSNNQLDLSFWSIVEPDGNYEWAVRARNEYAWGEYSTPWSFTVAPSIMSRNHHDMGYSETIPRTEDGTLRILTE